MAKSSSRRIHLLDELRGFDILLMIFFHAFYTMGWILNWEIGRDLYFFFQPAQPFFAGLFIFICGICCWFSHNNWLRGGVLAGIAVGMSLFLHFFMPDQMIWFGILHLLAVCILLFALLRPILNKIPAWLGLTVAVLLLLITASLRTGYDGGYIGIQGVWTMPLPIDSDWAGNMWLYPFGLSHIPGASDYFPLLPWFFVFLSGCFVGVWAKSGKFPKWTYRSHIPFLSKIGRHTLIIYVVHQPIIFGLGMGINAILERIG